VRSERGAIIVWMALFLLLLLAFGSLGVDVAKLAATRTQLQNAADAAALAGASALDPATGVIQTDVAVPRAQAAALDNKAFIGDPQPIVVNAGDVTFPGPGMVRVVTRRQGDQSVVTTLAQVLGITRLEMTATATAKVDTTGTALCGIVPLGCTPEPGQNFQIGCSNVYTLKLGGGAGTNGQFGAVDFPQCVDKGDCAGMPATGANTFRCLLEHGYCCPVSIGDVINTESGNMSGPTQQAIDYRFNTDVVRTENICYDDYLAAGGNGQRVVFVPITTVVAGNPSVTVTGFGAFFLRSRVASGVNQTLTGEFLYKVIPGTGGGSGSGAVSYSLRLVPNS
jgi:Flp pilus assembly protein TadG